MKHLLFCIILLIISSTLCLFSQQSTAEEELPQSEELQVIQPEVDRKADFLFFTFGLNFILNAEHTTTYQTGGYKSAPSPIFFIPSIGVNYPRETIISFAPRATFSLNYYLWSGESVLPAEIEHRTAITPSILLDLPMAYHFYTGNFNWTTGLGVAMFIRAGFLAPGVPKSEEGDIQKINKWFWNDARFLYPMIFISCEYKLNIGWTAGLDLRFYYPLGNAINPTPYASGGAKIFDTGMMSLAIRVTPPMKIWTKKTP